MVGAQPHLVAPVHRGPLASGARPDGGRPRGRCRKARTPGARWHRCHNTRALPKVVKLVRADLIDKV